MTPNNSKSKLANAYELVCKWTSMVISIKDFYIKFILTLIAIALVVIAVELSNRDYSTSIRGSIDVTGSMDTYEQNN